MGGAAEADELDTEADEDDGALEELELVPESVPPLLHAPATSIRANAPVTNTDRLILVITPSMQSYPECYWNDGTQIDITMSATLDGGEQEKPVNRQLPFLFDSAGVWTRLCESHAR
ncbi:hypothetical protein ACLQ3C_15795 [Gordonia sp. DT30]|uniref:hypothetical protein n=1 Tax=unclassified Gordonia (in: high G+C Gram-positive bacteria) TaxID=2657482 RepID=UPI003CE68DAC